VTHSTPDAKDGGTLDEPSGGLRVVRGSAALANIVEQVLVSVKRARPRSEEVPQLAGFLEGKAVVVTGGGGGIGRACALACASEGASVVVADIGVGLAGEDPRSEVAEAVVEEITAAGGSALPVAESVATMEGGERIVSACVERFGRIDGVVAVAGILRERMLFNMSEDEWDAVVATHLKGHFTVFRHAAAVMREQRFGSLVGFTSGAFAGSVAQANYAAAKGGIVSLVRSAAAGLYRYGVTANAIAPVARTRMSANVPMELAEMGDPEDVAPMVVYLLSDRAKHVTGQVYTVVGSKIAVWNQPAEVRAVYAEGRWTPEQIAERLDSTVGQERMALIDRLEEYRRAASSGEKPNA
jgi:NAD(P)-dependent dehydrogenase (short-subunit alcohol dehydrogenase family)